MPRGKLETFAGFAIKTGAVVYGFDNIKKQKSKIFCVLEDENLSENTSLKIKNLCSKQKIAHKRVADLDRILNTQNCKVVGITNKSLGEQIFNLKE